MNNTNTLLRTKPIVVQGIPDRVLQFIRHNQGRHHVNIFWGGGGLCKSWTSYPGQYADLSEGATKTK